MSPRDETTRLTPHAIFGVVIALLGVIFTLDNLGLADTAAVVRFWPVLPIAIGVMMLMHANTGREWVFGAGWMAAGGLLLANTLGWLSFRPRDFLPLLLVALGLKLILREREEAAPPAPPPEPELPNAFSDLGGTPDVELPPEPAPLDQPPPIPPPPPQFRPTEAPPAGKRPGCGTRRQTSDWGSYAKDAEGWTPWLPWEQWHRQGGGRSNWRDWESWEGWRGRNWRPRRGHIRMLALMSGVERRLRAQAFAGAEMTAVMGACELDLRHAEMQGLEVHISAFALWGGIEIRVPEHWVVVNRSMALMGGVEDTTRHVVDQTSRPRLIVHGFALMAGIEIKN